ncbi:MAG: extensin family protein [Hyphomicrobium sp.]
MARWPGANGLLFAALLSAAGVSIAAKAGEKSATTTDKIVDEVVVQPGKAIVKAAKSAIDELTPDNGKKKSKTLKSKSPGKDAPTATTAQKKPEAAPAADQKAPVNVKDQKPDADKAPVAIETKGGANTPAATSKIPPSFPKTLEDAKAEADAAKKPPPAWTPEEITAAKDRCTAILERINAVAIPEPPLREGACGAPAPIQLVSIGKAPEIAISPPALMTCELAEALETWMKNDIQPLARKHLGADVIKIETMSSYSCRNAYGRVGGKLSEHGLANALDIRGFVTSSAKTAYVLEDWGVTQREINAKIAAAKAAAEKAEADRLAAEKAAQENLKAEKGGPAAAPPAAAAVTSGAPAGGVARNTIVDGVPKLTVTVPGAAPKRGDAPALSVTEPNHLGGLDAKKSKAKVKSIAPESIGAAPAPIKVAGVQINIAIPMAPPPPTAKGDFLHKAHAAACRIFGTTLGPEANAAHRNHFHVDMAQRKVATTKICD